jgi:hypothetical protein
MSAITDYTDAYSTRRPMRRRIGMQVHSPTDVARLAKQQREALGWSQSVLAERIAGSGRQSSLSDSWPPDSWSDSAQRLFARRALMLVRNARHGGRHRSVVR